jgi:hypothetical protein
MRASMTAARRATSLMDVERLGVAVWISSIAIPKMIGLAALFIPVEVFGSYAPPWKGVGRKS